MNSVKNIFIHTDSLNERAKSEFDPIFAGLDKNAIIIPSFADVHVHLREPGFFYRKAYLPEPWRQQEAVTAGSALCLTLTLCQTTESTLESSLT